MSNKKNIGSFYTPKIIADFLVSYLSTKLKGKDLTILEPSAGDGAFINSIFQNALLLKRVKSITAIERERPELEKVRAATLSHKLEAINADFLEFQKDNSQKYSAVIGNPPYFKKNLLTREQLALCEEIHCLYPALSKNKIKNIWTAFLVRSIDFVKDDGVLAFVLPAELLQVKFAAELRALILKEFERVEIFTFSELLFDDCKGQDTVILIGERKAKNKGVYYCNVEKQSDLAEGKFTLAQNVNIKEAKWTHHYLSSDEFELLNRLKSKLQTVNSYCTSKAGIVTAANNYFIVNKETIDEYALSKFKKPIIQKGFFVNGSVELNDSDFEQLVQDSKPAFLLDLNKSTRQENSKLEDYLLIGKERKLDERYKMTIREKWFKVPNIGNVPEAFFFKRCNEYPKLIKNNAKVLVTDSAYKVEMLPGYEINNLIYSFYNSLTLAFAELDGRYYGGGVLELTPNEFKNLPVPYCKIDPKEFESYVRTFKAKKSIKEICKLNDATILRSIDKDLDNDSLQKLFIIREKLYLHRIKAKS